MSHRLLTAFQVFHHVNGCAFPRFGMNHHFIHEIFHDGKSHARPFQFRFGRVKRLSGFVDIFTEAGVLDRVICLCAAPRRGSLSRR